MTKAPSILAITVFANSSPWMCARDAISRAVYAAECVMVRYLTLWLSRNSFNRFAGILAPALS